MFWHIYILVFLTSDIPVRPKLYVVKELVEVTGQKNLSIYIAITPMLVHAKFKCGLFECDSQNHFNIVAHKIHLRN